MQFSLKWLLIAVAFVAVSLVALLNANDLWRTGFRTAVLFSVLVAIIGGVWSDATTRAFCVGYVLFTLCFFTRFFGTTWGSDLILQDALTAIHLKAFAFTEEKVASLALVQQSYDGDIVGVPASNGDGSGTILVVRPKQQHFIEVGHAACSVMLGIVGGCIAVAFYRRRKPMGHE